MNLRAWTCLAVAPLRSKCSTGGDLEPWEVDDLHDADPQAWARTLWRVCGLLLSLLWILCRLLCRGIHCLLCGLCTELSTFKVKATLANMNTTAPATSLCCLCCICNCLSYLCLCKCSLSLLGSNLYSLAVSYLCPPGGTVILVTRCTTSVLAANHTDKLLY
jgi:hypothetical protein